jgi:hypothetical protein
MSEKSTNISESTRENTQWTYTSGSIPITVDFVDMLSAKNLSSQERMDRVIVIVYDKKGISFLLGRNILNLLHTRNDYVGDKIFQSKEWRKILE